MKNTLLILSLLLTLLVPVKAQNDVFFIMPVEDAFNISGRGVVVTGKIESGIIKTGDVIEIIGGTNQPKTTTVTSIEKSGKMLDTAITGDYVGLLLRGIEKTDVSRGMVLQHLKRLRPAHSLKQKLIFSQKKRVAEIAL
jgi:elongation factor Tu